MRPLTARLRRYVVGWDTEDDSKGTPLLFTFVHERGSYYTRHQFDAQQWLLNLARDMKGRRVVEAWATNLEYDLVNLFGVERLPEVSFQFGRASLCGAKWERVEFRDTVRHVPASVEELGRLHGVRKLRRSRSVAYGMRDARITFLTARLVHSVYRKFGDRPRLTLPATAYSVWLHKFWKREVYGVLPEIRDAAQSAYFGGRTEAFALGTYEHVRAIDAASMFPWAMTAGRFPVPWSNFRRVGIGATPKPLGLYRARVTSDLEIPALPYRTDEGNLFPNGTWVGWYVGEELVEFGRSGGRFSVRQGFEWDETAVPFTGYVRSLFARKNRARGPMRAVFKLLLNSLYGKFGQQGGRVRVLSLEKFHAMKRAPLEFRVWNGLVVFVEKAPPPPWGNVLWSALITARARVRLHREFVELRKGGARILYSDTDSVIFSGPSKLYPKRATKPGDFEARGDYRAVRIEGKKEYGLCDRRGRWEVHIKGIPAAERRAYLEVGKATFERPVRLREGMRRDLQPNVWQTVTKERRTNHNGRSRKPDGSLLPAQVRE